MRKVLLLITFISSALMAAAQTGSIKGTVKDAITGEGVIGANVFIKGTTQGSSADINGDFEIQRVSVGTYTLIVSFISYKTDTLNVTVYADQTTVINTTLTEATTALSEVVVSGQRARNTDISIIKEIKSGQLVVAGISAQQISMSQDRDAAQVIKRIPGVTIFNNKFVNVRGLSERYNTVLLNNVIAPSTEVDSRAFAFDLIPSNMIDRMLVYKSGSSELPSEFAGAVINIDTKSIVMDDELSVNITTGVRAGTTFNSFNTETKGNTDWLGFDNGHRQLPSSFPAQNLRFVEPGEGSLTEISRSLPNNWGINRKTAAPDFRITLNYAKQGYLGNKKLSNITSFSYSNTRQRIEQLNAYYEAYNATEDYARYRYQDVRDVVNIRAGIISNFILELNPANKIEFRNLFNQQGSSQVTERSGFNYASVSEVQNRALNYQSRAMYLGQLSGRHDLSDYLSTNWIMGYSLTYVDQPDYRRIRSQRSINSNDDFLVVIPPGASVLDAGRFFSKLTENTFTHALNVEYKLNPVVDEQKQTKIKAGYYIARTDRSFNARWFSYRWNSATNINQEILTSDFTEIFKPENLGTFNENGQAPYFILSEGTNFSDQYIGINLLTAGYANVSVPFYNFRVSTGARLEYNRQQLNSYNSDGSPINVDSPVTNVLPFANLSYNFSERSLLRATYTNSVNRPTLREIAPFSFYDFERNADIQGNAELKTASIHSADLRWEIYPTKSESISIGAFYKKFNNPIELVLVGGSNLIYSFKNAQSARNYGVELEVRKSLEGIMNSALLDKITVQLNAAWINSNIDLSNQPDQIQNRAMQGQSPYIFNTAINYNNAEKGWQINLSHNIFGPRIFAVGDDQNATQFEMPRHQLDLTLSKEFNARWQVKFGVQDILNQRIRIQQDTDGDVSIRGKQDTIQNFKPGQYISLGVTCTL
jgi:TonB-dependent receptor